jgi:hypothetical protein
MNRILIMTAILMSTLSSHAQAGPLLTEALIMESSEKSKAPAPTAPPTALPAAAPASTGSLNFDNAKAKCIALGSPEGSNAFNSCIVTLMQ